MNDINYRKTDYLDLYCKKMKHLTASMVKYI